MTSRRDALAVLGSAATLAACERLGGPSATSERLGFAVVGLGGLATGQALPALHASSRCRVAALVSGTRDKLDELGGKYDVPMGARLTYEQFDTIARDPAIGAVYIALPNALHAEYAIRAARAGKHVLCEKPMATTVAECQSMIDAHRAAGTQLAVAYRLRHAPHHIELAKLANQRAFGTVRMIDAGIGFPVASADDWRLSRRLAGGGAMIEMGVYCIQACRQLAAAEPVEVSAFASPPDSGRYRDIEATMTWSMRYPNGVLANCATSYVAGMNRLWLGGDRGFAELDPAFDYGPLKGRSSEGKIRATDVNHFEAQFDAFADSIRSGTSPMVTAEEGLQDLRIVESIYRSVAERRAITL